MKAINHAKNSYFIRSFRELDRRLLFVMGSELLLIISIFIVFLIASVFLKTGFESLGFSDEDLTGINDERSAVSTIREKMQSTTPEKFQSFLINSLFNVILGLLISALSISFFKSREWSKIEGKKWSKSFFLKYLGLFLIWNLSWILLFLLIALGFRSSFVTPFVWVWFFLFTYFSFIVYPLFVKEKKIIKTIKKTFKQGFRIQRFILPFISIWIMLQIGWLIIAVFSGIPFLALVILAAYLLFYLAWVKFYMFLAVSKC